MKKLLVVALLLPACGPPPPAPTPGPEAAWPPEVRRELRGVWIATVSNIDWPSRAGLPPDSARAELRARIQRVAELGMNAIVFQVRPAGDALYASELEPWSEYLTGAQGRAPEPAWDPLAFAVEEAHARGIELHAWFNPYRARHPSARSEVAEGHLARRRPELVKTYGTHLWMDPGEPEVREHTLAVILDVVRRYDVDGVHLDDYFYPYKERDSAGAIIDFPDSASYARFRAAGGSLPREEWRRLNVDGLIERLYAQVKREKPWVKVGISPFGIWRPGYPAQIQGFDAYDQIYADARRWLE
ncbi:MAG TPA: family 10 glycosylhydrolase, partial [Longimicrobiales bacterium]|nr:family 10 glycosylhydrolase [Longimicrobiales bacterium]